MRERLVITYEAVLILRTGLHPDRALEKALGCSRTTARFSLQSGKANREITFEDFGDYGQALIQLAQVDFPIQVRRLRAGAGIVRVLHTTWINPRLVEAINAVLSH